MASTVKTRILLCSIFVVLALVIYLPIFFIDFMFMNDQSAFFIDNEKWSWRAFNESIHIIGIGRPIGAALVSTVLFLTRDIQDFATARFLSFVLCLGNMGLIVWFLTKRLKLDLLWALVLVLGLITLPGTQLIIIWTAYFHAGNITLLFAILSYLMLDAVNFETRNISKRHVWLLLGSFLAFIVSLLIYPPNSLIVFYFTMAYALFSPLQDWSRTRRVLLRDVIYFGFGMLSYFLLIKFILLPYFSSTIPEVATMLKAFADNVGDNALYTFDISTDLAAKLGHLVHLTKLAWQGNIAMLIPQGQFSGILFYLAVSCLAFGVVKRWTIVRSNYVYVLEFFLLIVVLAVLSNAPALAGRANMVAYRTSLPFCAIVSLILLYSLYYLTLNLPSKLKWIGYSLVALTVAFSGLVASKNLTNTALNSNLGLQAVRSSLNVSPKEFSKIDTIVLVHQGSPNRLIDKTLTYMFTNGAAIFQGSILAVLFERGLADYSNYSQVNFVETSRGGAREIIPFSDTSIIVNVNALSATETKRKFTKVKVTASARAYPEHAGIAAYDGAPHTYWLVENLPQHLEIEYPNTQKITDYSILSSHGRDRSPKAWKLLGSIDGMNWYLIDERNNQITWTEGAENRFLLKKPSQFKHYRFIFTEVNDLHDFSDSRRLLGISEIVLFNGPTPR